MPKRIQNEHRSGRLYNEDGVARMSENESVYDQPYKADKTGLCI